MVKSKQGYKLYTRKEMINLVTEFYKSNEKIVIRDLRHKNNLPSSSQITNEFGSFQNLLLECNIPLLNERLFKRKHLEDEEILELYKKFVSEHLKSHLTLPTNEDIENCEYIPCGTVFLKRFGSLNNLNRKIGYNTKEFNKQQVENDMIFKYKRACKDLGHTLSSREITRLSKENDDYIYCTEAYTNHFESLHNLQEICGLDKTSPGRNCTKEKMIQLLIWLENDLGRTPIQNDLIKYPKLPSASMYNREFGTFSSAVKSAGLKSTRIYKTKNGVTCRSLYELKLAQVLESYQINFVNEVMYKTIIPNFKRLYRFDFVLTICEKKYYIELFGIIGSEKYEKRKQEKIDLCTKYNIPLIELYQDDIYGKTNKEIYENLLEKIQLIKVA